MNKFNTLFEKLYNEHSIDLQQMRKKAILRTFLILLAAITLTSVFFISFIYLGVYNDNIEPLLLLLTAVFLVTIRWLYRLYKKTTNYTQYFKEYVIQNLITSYCESLDYHPFSTISPAIYESAEFEIHPICKSEDLITGNLPNGAPITMADVIIEVRSDDSTTQTFSRIVCKSFSKQEYRCKLRNKEKSTHRRKSKN